MEDHFKFGVECYPDWIFEAMVSGRFSVQCGGQPVTGFRSANCGRYAIINGDNRKQIVGAGTELEFNNGTINILGKG